MKYLSLFSGIGGFELGIQQAYEELYNSGNNSRELQTEGELLSKRESITSKDSENSNNKLQPDALVSCIGFSEIDKYAVQTYQKHFNHKNYGDITKINEKELPDFDLLVGGFPCQAFSIAGKRGGFSDTRGTLFFEIARIIREKQPRLLLLENVKGLLSHDKGNTFTTIISTLDELGYDLQWQVLNSKNFGVPQNRERVFIIGHLRGTSRPEVFPITGGSGQNNRILKEIDTGHDGNTVYSSKGLAVTQKALGGGQGGKGGLYRVGNLDSPTWQKRNESIRRVHDINGLSPTIPTGTGGGVMNKVIANTVDANYYKGINVNPGHASSNRGYKIDGKIRRLTPKECERLQGFPDDWTDEVSDTQRYKQCGNAVTVNVVREIIKKLV